MEDEKIFKELEKLEAEFPNIQKRKLEFFNDPETKSLGLSLLVAERLLDSSDPILFQLQAEVEEKKKACCQEEGQWKSRHGEICKQLQVLTGPEIGKGKERLRHDVSHLKVEKKIIDRTVSGFDMQRKVIISTNEDGVFEVQRIVCDAIGRLNDMRHRPISEIRDFVDQELKRIRAVDLSAKRKVVDENEHSLREWASSPVGNLP